RIEYSLLRRFWLVARREEGSIAAALCDPTSNDATSQKRRNPPGQGRFALRLRCSLSRVSLRIHSFARASPQSKTVLANCILSCGLGSKRREHSAASKLERFHALRRVTAYCLANRWRPNHAW